MENFAELNDLENEARKKDLTEIKFGNPGIRTNVWSKMCGLYGEAIGTFIGLNMDLAVQFFNQGFVTPLENYKNQYSSNLNHNSNEENINEENISNFKQVEVE